MSRREIKNILELIDEARDDVFTSSLWDNSRVYVHLELVSVTQRDLCVDDYRKVERAFDISFKKSIFDMVDVFKELAKDFYWDEVDGHEIYFLFEISLEPLPLDQKNQELTLSRTHKFTYHHPKGLHKDYLHSLSQSITTQTGFPLVLVQGKDEDQLQFRREAKIIIPLRINLHFNLDEELTGNFGDDLALLHREILEQKTHAYFEGHKIELDQRHFKMENLKMCSFCGCVNVALLKHCSKCVNDMESYRSAERDFLLRHSNLNIDMIYNDGRIAVTNSESEVLAIIKEINIKEIPPNDIRVMNVPESGLVEILIVTANPE